MARPYREPQAAGWWLGNPAFRRYMLREATALPLLLYALLLMTGVYALVKGEGEFLQWLSMLREPWCVALHAIAFAAAVFHAWTWLQLVPKILVVHTASFRIAPGVVKRIHQAGASVAFVLIVAVAWFFLSTAAS